jgi:tetratricopeptide (TPR) repeat protein
VPTAPETNLQATADLQRVTNEKNAYEARQLVEQAKAAHDAGNNEEALQKYSLAAEKDPSNQDAIAGKNAMMELTGRMPAGASQLDRVQQEIETRRQAIQYNFDTAVTDAESARNANNFTQAQSKLDLARVARNQDPQIFSPTELQAFDSRLADTLLPRSRFPSKTLFSSRQSWKQRVWRNSVKPWPTSSDRPAASPTMASSSRRLASSTRSSSSTRRTTTPRACARWLKTAPCCSSSGVIGSRSIASSPAS